MTNTTNTLSGPVLITECKREDGTVYGLDVETLDFKVLVTFRSYRNTSTREHFAKTRVYGALDAFVPGFGPAEDELFAAITDHAVVDPALRSFQRASTKTAKVELLRLLPLLTEALSAAGHEVAYVPVDARFSKKAGCSMCPCSPGFVADERMMVDGFGVDLHFSAV